jgi:MoaA/NifB/PqqE/SkfB family radical SAM enzyme
MNNQFGHSLFYWHFEVSSKCSLQCPRCPRTEKMGKYKITELSLDFFKKNFTEDFIRKEMDKVLFCGGQGDPIYCKEFLEIVSYFKTAKPEISVFIVTNGSYKTKKWWTDLNSILNEYDSITFSIDGWDDKSNNEYRVNSDFASILTAIEVMTTGKAVTRWSTILFKFNQEKIEHIENMAKSLGVNYFDLTFSMLFGSNNSTWIDPGLGYDPLEPDEHYVSHYGRHTRYYKELNFKELKISDALKEKSEYYHNIWLERSKDLQVLPLCMTNNRGKYVDAEGIIYPCSWVSHPFGERRSKFRDKVVYWKDSMWVANKSKFDLNLRSLEEVLNDETIWKPLIDGWQSEKKCFVECEQKCRYKEDYARKQIS